MKSDPKRFNIGVEFHAAGCQCWVLKATELIFEYVMDIGFILPQKKSRDRSTNFDLFFDSKRTTDYSNFMILRKKFCENFKRIVLGRQWELRAQILMANGSWMIVLISVFAKGYR